MAMPLLILFTESLDVRFAVRIEEFLAALLPRCFEFAKAALAQIRIHASTLSRDCKMSATCITAYTAFFAQLAAKMVAMAGNFF
jgi:hypothetical protein